MVEVFIKGHEDRRRVVEQTPAPSQNVIAIGGFKEGRASKVEFAAAPVGLIELPPTNDEWALDSLPHIRLAGKLLEFDHRELRAKMTEIDAMSEGDRSMNQDMVEDFRQVANELIAWAHVCRVAANRLDLLMGTFELTPDTEVDLPGMTPDTE